MDSTGPLPPDQSRGSILIIASVVLHVASLPVVATRIWTRCRPTVRLWWDDYAILVAVVCPSVSELDLTPTMLTCRRAST